MEQTLRAVGVFLTFAGGIAIGGLTLVGVAWWIFQTFSSKWLDSKFSRELENVKNAHQIELQRLRLQIDALLDRTIKLHTKEFEVLATAWQLLDEAFAATEALSGRLFRVPDLDNMGDEDIELALAGTSFSEVNKSMVRAAAKKNDAYINVLRHEDAFRAQSARIKFYNYFMANGIFLQPDFRRQFLEIHELILGACSERQFDIQHPDIPMQRSYDKSMKLGDEGKKKTDQLQTAISERLWSSANQAIPDASTTRPQ